MNKNGNKNYYYYQAKLKSVERRVFNSNNSFIYFHI